MAGRAPQQPRESGFTLIELLVVMVIVAILVAVAVPTFLAQKTGASASKVQQNILSIRKAIETCSTPNNDGSFTGCAEHGPIWKLEPSLAKLPLQDGTGPFTDAGEGKYDINGILPDGSVDYAPAATDHLAGYEITAYLQDGGLTVRFVYQSLPDGSIVRSCSVSPSGRPSKVCSKSRKW